MTQVICSQCGAEIEGAGIQHRSRQFCSDECCEEFEDQFLAHGEPAIDDLGDDEDSEDFDFEDDDDYDDDDDDDDLEDDYDPDQDDDDF